jgi:hypothetical protein
MRSGIACVRVNFSAADERLATVLYRRVVTLVHLPRAIRLGCARKYVMPFTGTEHVPCDELRNARTAPADLY